MKKKLLFFGAIFMILGICAQGQVYEIFYQGFESNDASNYTVTPTANGTVVSDLVRSGSGTLKIQQSTSTDVEIVTEMLDLTQYPTANYVKLEFDHICNIARWTHNYDVCKIYMKRENQSTWTQVRSTSYDRDGREYSNDFVSNNGFSRASYSEWVRPTLTDECWKSERFKFESIFTGVMQQDRKVQFKFVVTQRNDGATPAAEQAWWIDNIRVSASPNPMVDPKVSMVCYPDGGNHPSSRGARVILDARTSVTQGIMADSVYIVYTVGSDTTPVKATMTPMGTVTDHANLTWQRFGYLIPFCGYDTTMRFYCVVKDATSNYNSVTYPASVGSWVEYRCVRGVEQPGLATPGFTGSSNYEWLPFPRYADNMSEWVYDSALMAEAGYGPGAITDLRFTVGTRTTAVQTRPQFQIRMKNMPTSYETQTVGTTIPWMSGYMHVVYDSTLTLPAMNAGQEFTIHLADTFYYAGGDLVMQTIYNGGTTDPLAMSVKMITAPSGKQSKELNGVAGSLDDNPYNSTSGSFANANWLNKRPAIVMTQHANLPLVHDLGVSRVVFPSYEDPMVNQPSHLDVTLNNYGVATINGVRISYSIDDTIPGHFDWTGALAAGDSMLVTVNSNLTLVPGFHFVRVWVEDTLTAGTGRYRDHEPYNDSTYEEFIVCSGPLSGERQIGGTGADYNTIEEFLFSLSRCGIDDSLVVKLSPGQYEPFVLPYFDGLTESHYVVFESLDPAHRAILYADGTTGATHIVDLGGKGNVRFRNLTFVRRAGALAGMVNIDSAGTNCRFEGCLFADSLENPTAAERIPAMLNTNFADSILVSGCTFVGGVLGVNVLGRAVTVRSQNNVVRGNVFRNQYSGAVSVVYQTDIVVEHNEMYDALNQQSSLANMRDCYGTIRLTGNRIYTTHGAGAISVSALHGTEDNRAQVTNNMVEIDDDGSANIITTPFNIISGEWVDVAYNSVSMKAPTRSRIAAATFGALTDSRFVNNIVACNDATNYAFHYMPGNQTSNRVSNNVYYTVGNLLNYRQGASYPSLEAWTAVVAEDTTSIVANPSFLHGWLTDLRTYNRVIKGVGMPLANVTVDIYDSVRDDEATCPGAFEFDPLRYEFAPEMLMSPQAAVCGMPDSVELVVRIRNRGIDTLYADSEEHITLMYRVNGGATGSVELSAQIPAEDTVSVSTGVMLHLPANGIMDATYTIEMWTVFASDPNMTNDTSSFTVTSRYEPNAPTDVTQAVNYMDQATITITEGINQWSTYAAASSPTVPSTVYWYRTADADVPFHTGNSLTTTELRRDTTFYVKQHREVPMVRITQVMARGNSSLGLTDPTPAWMTGTTQVAVQLTNVGDDTAYMQGDTLRSIATTSAVNNKIARFGDMVLLPGQSVVVQFNSGTPNEYTVYTGNNTRITPAITSDFGFVYRHDGATVDAVAFNDITTAASSQNVKWSTQNVPDYVWSGGGIAVSDAQSGGVVRTAFNGGAADWRMASVGSPMFLDGIDQQWIRYADNGCPGGVGTVHVVISNPPTADVEVAVSGELPQGCMLGDEPVTVHVSNYGSAAIEGLQLNYTLGGADTVTENLATPLGADSDTLYTFLANVNLSFDRDSVATLTVWATHLEADPFASNDSASATTTSLYTLAAPDYTDSVTAEYGTAYTFAIEAADGRVPVWYDYNMNPIDTSLTYTTDLLYYEDYVGVSYIVAQANDVVVGNDTKKNNKTAYPSPYQTNNKYSKQQYIYTATELQDMGFGQGFIKGVAFYLDSIHPVIRTVQGHKDTTYRDTILFTKYSVSLGTTTESIFPNKLSWKSPQVHFERDSMLLLRSQSHGWVWHQLDSTFYWDGVSNIVVQVAYLASEKHTGGLETRYTTNTGTVLYKSDDSDTLIANFTGQGTISPNRPNITFRGEVMGCNGPIKPIKIGLIGVPQFDASLEWPAGSDTVTYRSAISSVPKVTIRNLGHDTITTVKLHYFIDNDTVADTTSLTLALPSGDDTVVDLFSATLAPGRHAVKAVLALAGDTIAGNDTITTVILVRFSAGVYSINADTAAVAADFHSFAAAVDTLNTVGIVGNVVFNVASGVYNESVWLDNVYGTGSSTLTFVGPSTDSITVRLVGNTTEAANYVFRLTGIDGISIENLCIEARPQQSANFANAMVVDSCSNVSIDNCHFKVRASSYNVNAACLVLNNGCSTLSLANSILDSGYYGFRSTTSDNRYTDITIAGNRFRNFQSTGIELNDVSILFITGNELRSGAADNSRGMLGIFLTNVDSTIYIMKNKVYLLDQYSGSKRGIHLVNVMGSSMNVAYVANNMISTNGTGATGLATKNPSGIYIDGNSEYINVIFNTVRVYAGASQNDTRAFFSGAQTRNLQVMNNVFANLSQSHAYYVTAGNSIIWSDNNAYYTNGNTLAYWGSARSNLAALQAANGKDENSVQDEPYFTADDDLHMLMTNFCDKAQYSTDIMDDIDGKERPMQPRPTIGAHEMERLTHNMTVLRLTEPRMPPSINNPYNIETLPVLVNATFYNNGSLTESNVSWYAYVEGHETATRSATRNLGSFAVNERRSDTVYVPTIMGLIDTQRVRVVLVCDGDEDTLDNAMSAPVYLAPAYDLEATSIRANKKDCAVNEPATITITIKNNGKLTMPANSASFTIGYDAQAYHPNYNASDPTANMLDIATMPQGVSETHTLEADLNPGASTTVDFNTPANLYPTDTSLNIKVRLTGWVNYQYDIVNDNDHTGSSSNSSPLIDAYFTPNPPVGHDVTFPYGTWGDVTAEQENGFVVRWYRDSTANTPFLTPPSGANAYTKSCTWSNTPAYFHDSTYYLCCKSDKNCQSHFSEVHVHAGSRVANDVACEAVLAPLGGRVYMENDTVRVRIANYGTQSKSNIPVTYQLRKGSGTAPLQTVTETCTANIPAGQTYIYTFDSLVRMADPLTAGTYYVRAWTDLANDQARRNDTIRTKQEPRPTAPNNTSLDYEFRALGESAYASRVNKTSDTVDIVRFSFNEIDIDLPPLGRSYTNLGVFNNPEVPVLHVTRGMRDTAYIMITCPTDPNVVARGKVAAYIDFNRNGHYTDTGECVIPVTNLYNNTLLAAEIVIPSNASLGYMRMCVSATPNLGNPTATIDGAAGHMLNFLLFVDEQPVTTDLSFTQIIAPRDYLIKDNQPRTISFRMANRGRQPITATEIFYEFATENPDSTVSGSFQWTGNLAPGTAVNVDLPSHDFNLGTTTVRIWHALAGDVNDDNNSLSYEYHRFHTIVLAMNDDFDSINYWYAPVGYNNYTRNYWQCGLPSKTKLDSAYSFPNAWVTDLNAPVGTSTGARGNISYLYSPIINIMQVKPDTLSFYMARNLLGKSCMYLEYYNYNNQWVKVETDSVTDLPWYNDVDNKVFSNKNANDSPAYSKYSFSTRFINGNFQERFQFRIVYSVPQTSGNYGEGCAIDNFHIGRERRRTDLGVVAINQPTAPKYGQTVYPEVVVKNYGSETARYVEVGYIYNGVNLPRMSSFSCNIPPDSTATFTMTTPLVLTSSLPDSITLSAFTVNSADIYNENDTASRDYVILPIDSDISAEGFISPVERVITGDSVTVTMRVRNFGVTPITDAQFTYTVNGQNPVTESISVDDGSLVEPLESRQYLNYTFKQKFRATMGVMNIMAYVKSSVNEYIYNDTIHKRVNGISAVTDLAAAAIILDTSSLSEVRVELAVENRGARGANDFEVGFWVDDDSNNVHREVYHTYMPLPALHTGYHLFQTTLPPRSAPYDHITAFVSVLDDNDPSNDTTTVFATQFVDLAAVAVLVEENSRPDCSVYFSIRNNGNMTVSGRAINLTANINGNELTYTAYVTIRPGDETLIKFNRTIPKSPQRRYSGTASVSVSGDSDDTNNQTSDVSVVNYVEGTPTVDNDALALEQNYPNPFSGQTTIPFTLPSDATVRLFVMDATGHMVYTHEGFYHSGDNSLTLDMSHFPAGVYYYGIETPSGRLMRKMILR